MADATAADIQDELPEEGAVDNAKAFAKQIRPLGVLAYWGLIAFLLAYSGVLMGGLYFQFGVGEYPCPLCMIQRYGMMLATMGAMWILVEARRGRLDAARYAQGLGMAVVGSVVGGAASTRQVLLHIRPGDEGYGEPVLGIHLYTWALITFAIVVIYAGLALILAPRAIPVVPKKHGIGWKISTLVMWLFMAIVLINLVMIIFLEGFAWILPDDPTSYNLIDQLTGSG